MAVDLQMISYRFRIQDAEAYNSLTDKCDYGRLTPYGTGPYKVVSVDRNQGIMVERFDGSKLDPKYSPAPIKRVHGVPLPDRQTQIAQLLTNGIDIVRNVSPDNAVELAKNPSLEISTLPTASFYYIVLDAAGRSGHKAVQDPRVQLVSEPPVTEGERLSWLVLGRAPGEAGTADLALLQAFQLGIDLIEFTRDLLAALRGLLGLLAQAQHFHLQVVRALLGLAGFAARHSDSAAERSTSV